LVRSGSAWVDDEDVAVALAPGLVEAPALHFPFPLAATTVGAPPPFSEELLSIDQANNVASKVESYAAADVNDLPSGSLGGNVSKGWRSSVKLDEGR
jgi:hypothetical protein